MLVAENRQANIWTKQAGNKAVVMQINTAKHLLHWNHSDVTLKFHYAYSPLRLLMKDKQLLGYGPTFLILKLDTDNSKDWLQPVMSL